LSGGGGDAAALKHYEDKEGKRKRKGRYRKKI